MNSGGPEAFPFSAFISYASQDGEKAQEICASLEARGLACWIAPRNIRAGHEYGEEIVYGIRQSRCLVLVLSDFANQSPFVRREVERAVSGRKPVFPVRIEEVMPSPSLELFVSATHWIDAWSGDLLTHIDQLARDLTDESTLAQGAQASTMIAKKKLTPFWQKPSWIASAAVIIALAAAIFALTRGGGGSAVTYTPETKEQVEQKMKAQMDTYRQALQDQSGNVQATAQQYQAQQLAQIRQQQRDAHKNALLKLTSGDAATAPDVFETFDLNQKLLSFTFSSLPSNDQLTTKYTFDDGGYFQLPQQFAGQYVITDVMGGTTMKVLFSDSNGKQFGPYVYQVQDRTTAILSSMKGAFQAVMPKALLCVRISQTIPLSYSDYPLGSNIDTSFKIDNLAVPHETPAVLCSPNPDSRYYNGFSWAGVKEIHVSIQPNGPQQVVPIDAGWDELIKSGKVAIDWKMDSSKWQLELPVTATTIYADYVFQDGSDTGNTRYSITDMQPFPGLPAQPGDYKITPSPTSVPALR